MNEIWRHRSGLQRTLQKIQEGKLTIGFIGGSITDGRAKHNWPEPVTAWFVEHFPETRIVVENAAIGATGSALAAFRAKRDLIDRGCDLVFVEYAVNDSGVASESRKRSREGLIRQLLAGEGRDAVIVYTYNHTFYEAMAKGEVPVSIHEFEHLADHYGLGSVWMSLYAMNEVRKGHMRWEEWLPDGLHPTSRGSLSYAHSVIAYLEKELLENRAAKPVRIGDDRPAPLNDKHWEFVKRVDWDQILTNGPWSVQRSTSHVWMDHILTTPSPGAGLGFRFEGTTLVIGLNFGKTSADFKWRLDGGDWQDYPIDRSIGAPEDDGRYNLLTLASDLQPGVHHIELEVVHGNREDCKGTNFKLALAGYV